MLCQFTIFLLLSNAVDTNTSNRAVPKPKEYAERILQFGKTVYVIINSNDFSKSMDDMKAFFGKLRQQTTARNYEIDNQNPDADVKGCVEQIESNERFTPISVESLTKIDNITLKLMHWLSKSNIHFYDETAIALIYLATKIKKTYICCIASLYGGVKEFNRAANEIFEDERVIDKSTELRKFEKHYNNDAQELIYMFDKLDTYRQQIKEILEKYESALASQESSSLNFLSQPITIDLVKQHFSHIGTYHIASAKAIICKLNLIARYYYDNAVFTNEVTQSMTFIMSFSILEAKYFLKVIGKYIEQLKKVDPKCSYKSELGFWNDARLWQLRMYKTYLQRSLNLYIEILTDYSKKSNVQTVPMVVFDEDMRSLVDTYEIIQDVVNEALKVVPRIYRKSTPNSYRIYAGFILSAIFCLAIGLYICTKIKRR